LNGTERWWKTCWVSHDQCFYFHQGVWEFPAAKNKITKIRLIHSEYYICSVDERSSPWNWKNIPLHHKITTANNEHGKSLKIRLWLAYKISYSVEKVTGERCGSLKLKKKKTDLKCKTIYWTWHLLSLSLLAPEIIFWLVHIRVLSGIFFRS